MGKNARIRISKLIGAVALGSSLVATGCMGMDADLDSTFSCEQGITDDNPNHYTFSLKIQEGIQVNLPNKEAAKDGKDVKFIVDGYTSAQAHLQTSGLGSEKTGTVYMDDKLLARDLTIADMRGGLGLELKHDYWNFLAHHQESLGSCTIQVDPQLAIAAYNQGATLEYSPSVSQAEAGSFLRPASELGCTMIRHAKFSVSAWYDYTQLGVAQIGPSGGCSDPASAEVYDYFMIVHGASLDPDFLYQQGVTRDYTPNSEMVVTYTGVDASYGEPYEVDLWEASAIWGDSPGADPSYNDMMVGYFPRMGMQIDKIVAGDIGFVISETRDGKTYEYANCRLNFGDEATLEQKVLESVNTFKSLSLFPNDRVRGGGLECVNSAGFDRGNTTGGIAITFGAYMKQSFTQSNTLDPSKL